MKISELIAEMNGEIDSNATDAQFVGWINEVNDDLFSMHIKRFTSAQIDAVEGQALYTLPEGIDFDRIEEVYVNDVLYPVKDLREPYTKGYYEDGNKLGLYPVPAADDTDAIRIIYLYVPPHHLVARIEGDSLRIPEAFKNVYKYYCYYKLFLDIRQEPGMASNYAVSHNMELAKYLVYRSRSTGKRNFKQRRRWEL